MKRFPYPALRRLSLNGAAPARAMERLRSADNLLSRVGRGPAKLDWIFGTSLDSLIRPLDLSGLGRKADVLDGRATRAAVDVPSRGHKILVEAPGLTQAAPAPGRLQHDSGIAALLHAYSPVDSTEGESAVGGSATNSSFANPNIAARQQDEPARAKHAPLDPGEASNEVPPGSQLFPDRLQFPDRVRSAFSEHPSADRGNTSARKTPDSISPAGATAWLRNRAALASAATSADTPVVPAINDDVDRILQRTMAAAHETVSASASIKPGPENAIARLSRTLEVLRDIPRERPARNSTREFAPARPRTILQDQEHSQQHQSSASTDELGLRGLVARAERSNGELRITHPPASERSEDLANRLTALLREEARRQGIDLEEIER